MNFQTSLNSLKPGMRAPRPSGKRPLTVFNCGFVDASTSPDEQHRPERLLNSSLSDVD